MTFAKNSLPSFCPSQRGVALIVALVLLLIMSIYGIYSVRSTILEEKMTASGYDRSLAFQAAEAALRQGEAKAMEQATADLRNNGFPNGGLFENAQQGTCENSPCANGLCAQPDPDCTPRWLDSSFNGWVNGSKVNDLEGTPQYFVEYLGDNFRCDPDDFNSEKNCSHYRVTARSNLGPGRAAVMLQSIYLTP